MKRNLFRIAMASVAAIALGAQNPASAATGGITGGGEVPKIVTLDVTTANTLLSEIDYTQAVAGTSGGYFEETATDGAVIMTNDPSSKATVSIGSITNTELGTVPLKIQVKMISTGGTTFFNKTFSSVGNSGSAAQESSALSMTDDMSATDIYVRIERNDGKNLDLASGSGIALPMTFTITGG